MGGLLSYLGFCAKRKRKRGEPFSVVEERKKKKKTGPLKKEKKPFMSSNEENGELAMATLGTAAGCLLAAGWRLAMVSQVFFLNSASLSSLFL